MSRSASRASLVATSMLVLDFASVEQADAHAHLLSSTPAANGMAMPAPTELRLKFSEGLDLKFTGVTVTGSNRTAVKTGPAKLDPKDDTALIVPLTDPLADGKYKVDWHALSTDGHKTTGSYSFESMQ